jgi:O-Antigen ligase
VLAERVADQRAPAAGRLDALAATALGRRAVLWLFAFGLVFALAADSGGYWPTAWGWSALAALWVLAIALVLKPDVRIARLAAVQPLALLAFVCWSMTSSLWGSSATQPARSTELALVYAGATAAALVLASRRSYRALLAGAWAAAALICGYALLTRCFPERLGSIDDLAGYRLQQPLGYWNALGILAVVALLLSLGFAARGRSLAVRGLAGAAAAVAGPALYFTYSRGAWIALGIGLLAAVAADRQRLQLIASFLVVGTWPAAAIAIASRSDALTHQNSTLAAASHAGHRFAFVVLGLAVAAGAVAVAGGIAERRARVPRVARLAFAAALVLAVLGALAAVTIEYGSPARIARRAYHGFVTPAKPISGDLNKRLFSLSGGQRVPQWKVAWKDYRRHPWLGSGAGSYERWWTQLRPVAGNVRNAHSLYLETLAETGPVGLALLLSALLAPLVALFRRRRRALAGTAAGAYAAFLAHAGVDWDWQMPAVTLAALFCGSALLASSRIGEEKPVALSRPLRVAAIAVSLALVGFAFVGLRGNRAIAAAEHALGGDSRKAETDARRATRWTPWSSRAWQLLGEAQSAEGDLPAARASLRHAIAKDGEDWSIWLDYALVSSGAERRRALAEARALNPLNSAIPAGTNGT